MLLAVVQTETMVAYTGAVSAEMGVSRDGQSNWIGKVKEEQDVGLGYWCHRSSERMQEKFQGLSLKWLRFIFPVGPP